MSTWYVVIALKGDQWVDIKEFREKTKADVLAQGLRDINKYESKVVIREHKKRKI